MNTKELIFDMDGTIADLYSVDKWLEKLRAEDASPYREARPLYDTDVLNTVLDLLKGIGYRVVIVSWCAKGSTRAYDKAVKRAKLEWLDKVKFPYDEVHIVKYGTPKQRFIKSHTSILVDDNDDVQSSFLKSIRGREKKVIDAKGNIVEQLVNLLVA